MLLDQSRFDQRPTGPRSERRRERIRKAVKRGVNNWRYQNRAMRSLPPIDPDSSEPLVRPIPHPKRMVEIVKGEKVGIPQAQEEVFEAGVFRTSWRLVIWMWLTARLLLGNLWDIILRRNTIHRNAVRLRLVLQSGGATFIKLGQQLSLRIDLLPYEYATELENMLDKVEPFPFEVALKAIKAATPGPFEETYAAIDPDPIGAASMSCVYHAVLQTGERVAVKVRRPGVGIRLAADMRALGWMMTVAELFALPPGFTRNFVSELKAMLMAELNFRMEARQQDIFRRRVRKAGLKFVTAPKIKFHLSNYQVITEEFVMGVWLTDLLTAVENKDEESLAILRQNGILPRKVARRLLKVTRWSGFEGLLFHADLHPANVLVARDSNLMLIDFGSCGAFTKSEVTIWRRLLYAQHNEDVAGMAQASISLLEPLPPVDIDELTSRVEALHWEHLYAYKDKHAEWWERTSAQLWIGFLKLAQEMHIPMGLNTLKMIRASMLVDTLALRLDKKIDQYKEFNKYMVGAGKRTKKRLRRKWRDLFKPAAMVELDELFDASRTFMYRVKRAADISITQTTSLVGKAAFAASVLFQFIVASVILCTAAGVAVTAQRAYAGMDINIWAITYQVISHPYTQIALLVMLFVYGRRVVYRLHDKE